jgi:hypothetical protein
MAINPSLINLLKRRINFLRAVVLIILTSLIVITILAVLIISYYADLDTIFLVMLSPQAPKSSLYLVPNVGKYKVGDEFAIDVLIDTKGNDVVVSAAYLSYNKEKREALEIDTSDSVFTIEAEREIIHQEGKIKITLGKPTPGINLSGGKIAAIRFRALESITPQINNIYFDFTPHSSRYSTVILDNKLGTNILSFTRGAKIYID